MRIVVLIPTLNASAELALNKLLKRKDLNVIGLVRSDNRSFRTQWKYVKYGVRRSGIFYGALIAMFAYLHLVALPLMGLFAWNRKRKWQSIDQLIKKYDLEVLDTEDINSKGSIEALESMKPDILVSLYFNQILKKPVIELPKVAAINMHPGLLPKYRGLMPDFWKLHNKEKYAGVTIHHINEKIDEGDVIAQMRYPIKKDDTKFSLGLRGAQYGTKLLIKTLSKMVKGVKMKPLILKGRSKYYSLPRKRHFDSYFAQGKKLFSFLGVWREIDRRY